MCCGVDNMLLTLVGHRYWAMLVSTRVGLAAVKHVMVAGVSITDIRKGRNTLEDFAGKSPEYPKGKKLSFKYNFPSSASHFDPFTHFKVSVLPLSYYLKFDMPDRVPNSYFFFFATYKGNIIDCNKRLV